MEGQIQAMQQMLESGLSIEKIADIVKRPVEEVRKLTK